MNSQLLRSKLVSSIKSINFLESAVTSNLLKRRYLSHNCFKPQILNLKNKPKFVYLNTSFCNSSFLVQTNNFSYSSKANSSKMPPIEGSVGEYVERFIKENKIVVFSTTTCPFCVKAKDLLGSLTDETVNSVSLDVVENGPEMKQYLIAKTNQKTVPNIFINGLHCGGFSEIRNLHAEGRLVKLLTDKPEETTADLKPAANETLQQFVDNLVKNKRVVIFGKSNCPFCAKVKDLFKSMNEEITYLEVDKMSEGFELRDYLYEKTGQKTFPNVYVNGKHIGGSDSTLHAHSSGRLEALLKKERVEDETQYDYDLVVIGGGSGGLAASKKAAVLGKKVACLDFVVPSPAGTQWGLGGTCVNVGCIPKKLMHQSALLGEALQDSKEYGWKTPDQVQHDWETMKNNIQDHIGSLNWAYRVELRDKKIDYINGYGEFLDSHKLKVTMRNKKEKEITAKNVIIAVGGRPKYPEDLIGAQENTITSDDLFQLSYNPGKTLCVGASYVSLECAGFLKGIGLDVTVMVRSILLRGFDQQMANLIGDYMEKHGVKFTRGAVPTEIVKVKAPEPGVAPGEYIVKYKTNDGQILEETYNTILLAVGREAATDKLGLDKAGVAVNPKNKKIITTFEQTNVDHIYAIGDAIDESSAGRNAIELTPVAIQAGQLLGKRMFDDSDVKMDYYNVPTTVFTPLEYGAIGYSEEDAIAKFGEENIEVYHQNFWPLEWTVAHKPHDVCYAKLICNKADKERVVGLHVAGPNAGEITQGYAIALKLRATKNDFNQVVGIHPTNSEIFTTMNITKASGLDIAGAGC